MKVELISKTPNAVELCQQAAGICVGTQGTKGGLKVAMISGHESVLEHAVYTFRIEGVSRALLAQLTRHRIASFSVESQRYCSYVDEDIIEHVTPGTVMKQELTQTVFDVAMEYATEAYRGLIDLGVPEEDARYVLPNAACTKIQVTMNARELRHFFSLRCCRKAQWEIRELANAMLDLVKDEVLFTDAGAPCVRGACKEVHPCTEE